MIGQVLASASSEQWHILADEDVQCPGVTAVNLCAKISRDVESRRWL